MAANFLWAQSRKRIVESAENALRDVGYVLHARRLHLGLSGTEVAEAASVQLGQRGHITKGHITSLEKGKLPPAFSAGYTEVRAVLGALEWRESDVEFMVHMIHEFARIAR